MATNSFLGFSEDGSQLFEMKSKMARQVGDDASDSVKSTIRSTLGVPASAEGLTPANNLSDVASAATSRTNLDVMAIADVNDRANSKAPSNGILLGDDGYLRLPSFPAESTDDNFTTCFKVRFASTPSAQAIVCMLTFSGTGSSSTNGGLILQSDNTLDVNHYDGSFDSINDILGGAVDVNRTYHIAYRVASGDEGLAVFVDGVKKGTVATGPGTSTGRIWQIGVSNQDNSGTEFLGLVHYNRVLTDAEIAEEAVRQVPEVADQWGNNTEIIVDGDMEAAGVTNWSSYTSNATVTKATGTPHGGSQCLRVAAGSASAGYTEQTLGTFETGQRIRVRGWARGDGTRTPTIRLNGSSWQNIWTGTSSTSWQEFDVTFLIAAGSLARLNLYTSSGSASGEYVEWDDLSWKAVGAVVALLPTPGSIESDGTWLDSSSNTLNGTPTGVTPLFQNPQPSGTFTPSILLGGSGAGQVYNTTNTFGHYQVLNSGTLCHVWGRVQFAGNSGDKGSGTGAVVLAGLPKTSSTSAADAMPFTVPINNGSGLTSLPLGMLSSGSTQATLYDSGSAGLAALDETNLLDSAILRFNFVYQIN